MAASNNVYASVAGVWQSCIPYVKVSGAWQPVQEGWTKIAGTWTQFYTAVTVALSGTTQSDNVASGTATVSYYLTSGGKEQYSIHLAAAVDIGDWVVPNGSASAYECRMTMTGGTTFSSGDGAGTWLALSSTRSWTVTRSTVGTKQATAIIEIRDVATSTLRATSSIDITADRS